MGYVDICGIIEETGSIKHSRRRKKLTFFGVVFRFLILAAFLVSVTFVAVEFANSGEDIKKLIASNSENIKNLNKIITDKYIAVKKLASKKDDKATVANAENFTDIEPAAGEDAEIDALLDWEDQEAAAAKPAETTQPTAAVEINKQSPVVAISPITQNAKVETKSEPVQQVQPQIAIVQKDVPEQPAADSKLAELEKNVSNLLRGRSDSGNSAEINKSLAMINKDLTEIKRQMMILSNKVIDLDDKFKKSQVGVSSKSSEKVLNGDNNLKSNSDWKLRSAKGDVAWLSKKGSNDLIAVGAGDEVLGIGKVEKVGRGGDGKWYVKGTAGIINQ